MKKKEKPKKTTPKTWFVIDSESDPLIDTETRLGMGSSLKQALEDFKDDVGKRPKYYAYKLTLLGEINEEVTIK